MEKYYITCDLEKTSQLGRNFNSLISFDLESVRNKISYLIDLIFEENVCEIITFDKIANFFQSIRREEEYILSLDNGIYVSDSDFYFDSTRLYNSKEDILINPKNYSIKQRDGSDLKSQIKPLLESIKKIGKDKIILCDDGIFSGDTLDSVIKLLKKNGINISKIRVILNFSGKEYITGIKIEAMESPKSCIDWIDERDFFYGFNMSGASFYYKGKINGIPYIANQKIAQKKASIPEKSSKFFCKNMISINSELWEKLQNINQTSVAIGEIQRINFLEYDYKTKILDVLEQEKIKI